MKEMEAVISEGGRRLDATLGKVGMTLTHMGAGRHGPMVRVDYTYAGHPATEATPSVLVVPGMHAHVALTAPVVKAFDDVLSSAGC